MLAGKYQQLPLKASLMKASPLHPSAHYTHTDLISNTIQEFKPYMGIRLCVAHVE